MPKFTHNSTTTVLRVLGRHGYVHGRHIVAVFIRNLIHSHVCLFVCLLHQDPVALQPLGLLYVARYTVGVFTTVCLLFMIPLKMISVA
jgi:hypothetical protein